MKTTVAARASSFLVHFFDVDCTTMKWNIRRFIEKVNIRRQILLFLSANSVLRASLAPYHLISNAHWWNNCLLYRRVRYIEFLLYLRWEHSPLINDCPLLDSSGNIICGRPGWVLLLLTLIPPLPPKQHITPTLIPPAAQGKFEPEWQTKNHYVDELAPLNRYLFIYLFTYPLWPEGY